MRVNDSLGDAGAAAGEQDCGHLIGASVRKDCQGLVTAELPYLIQRPTAPAVAPTDGHANTDTRAAPAEQDASQLRLRNTYERFRLRLDQADTEVFRAHAWIDQH